jgi:hypothetical protein
MELASLSPATAQLAVELQLADVKAIMQGMVEGDEYTAFQAMRMGFQDVLLLLRDQMFAMDLLRTDHAIRVVSETLIREERQAEQDYSPARELGGVASDQNEPSITTPRGFPEGQYSWLGDSLQMPCSELANVNAILEHGATVTTDRSELTFPICSTGQYDTASGGLTNSIAESSTGSRMKGKGRASGIFYGDEHITHFLLGLYGSMCPI